MRQCLTHKLFPPVIVNKVNLEDSENLLLDGDYFVWKEGRKEGSFIDLEHCLEIIKGNHKVANIIKCFKLCYLKGPLLIKTLQ